MGRPVVLLVRKHDAEAARWVRWASYSSDASAERAYNSKIRGRGITAWAWWGPRATAEKMLKDPDYFPPAEEQPR